MQSGPTTLAVLTSGYVELVVDENDFARFCAEFHSMSGASSTDSFKQIRCEPAAVHERGQIAEVFLHDPVEIINFPYGTDTSIPRLWSPIPSTEFFLLAKLYIIGDKLMDVRCKNDVVRNHGLL